MRLFALFSKLSDASDNTPALKLTEIKDNQKAVVAANARKLSFDSSRFENAIKEVLAEHGFKTARPVGHAFHLDDAARASIKGAMPGFPDFVEATAILVEKDGENAAGFVAGRLKDGSSHIISVQNFARPDDIQNTTDRISARRHAHRMREILGVTAIPVAAERSQNYAAAQPKQSLTRRPAFA